jgi:hypothetical protein
MQPFDVQPTLPFPTDTAIPCSPIPIFYVHGDEHPFCATPGCFCHRYAEDMQELLQGVIAGDVYLRPQLNGTIRWEVTDGPA